MPVAALSTLHLLIYLILTITLWGRSYYCHHFTYEETKIQGHRVVELEFEFKHTGGCDKEREWEGTKK